MLATGGKPLPDEPQSPHNFVFKTNLPFYPWLETPGNEHRLARFGHAMNGTRFWEVEENVVTGELRSGAGRVWVGH